MGRLAGRVGHHTVFDHQFAHRYVPLTCGSTQQACAGGCRCHAQRPPRIGNAGRPAGRVDAEFPRHLAHHPLAEPHRGGLAAFLQVGRMKWQGPQQHHDIAVNLVRTSLFQRNAGQGDIQLFGHHHRKRRVHALTHFAARHRQNHPAVGGNFDPAVQCNITLCRQHQIGRPKARPCRQYAPAHHQGTCSAQGTQYPCAALHAAAPGVADASGAPAARCIALRTRW